MSSALPSIIKGIESVVLEQVELVIKDLAEKYGFSFDHEFESFVASYTVFNPKSVKNTKKITKTAKPVANKPPAWKLPFNGTVYANKCHAICKADGLYIQCSKLVHEDDLCKTCFNKQAKNGSLPYGHIDERAAVGLYEFRFEKYAPLPYSVYMKKHNITREDVDNYTRTLGITLSDEHFVDVPPPKRGGGRKRKNTTQVIAKQPQVSEM
jgi:hypothetical protein